MKTATQAIPFRYLEEDQRAAVRAWNYRFPTYAEEGRGLVDEYGQLVPRMPRFVEEWSRSVDNLGVRPGEKIGVASGPIEENVNPIDRVIRT